MVRPLSNAHPKYSMLPPRSGGGGQLVDSEDLAGHFENKIHQSRRSWWFQPVRRCRAGVARPLPKIWTRPAEGSGLLSVALRRLSRLSGGYQTLQPEEQAVGH